MNAAQSIYLDKICFIQKKKPPLTINHSMEYKHKQLFLYVSKTYLRKYLCKEGIALFSGSALPP